MVHLEGVVHLGSQERHDVDYSSGEIDRLVEAAGPVNVRYHEAIMRYCHVLCHIQESCRAAEVCNTPAESSSDASVEV